MKKIFVKTFSLCLIVLTFTSCDNSNKISDTKSTTTPVLSVNIKQHKNTGKIVSSKKVDDGRGVNLLVQLNKGSVNRGDTLYYINPETGKTESYEIEGILDNDKVVNSVKATGKFEFYLYNVKDKMFKENAQIYFEDKKSGN